jgi:hypothetical protein
MKKISAGTFHDNPSMLSTFGGSLGRLDDWPPLLDLGFCNLPSASGVWSSSGGERFDPSILQRVDQGSSCCEIGGSETLGEPVIHRLERCQSIREAALIPQQSRKACRGAKFSG